MAFRGLPPTVTIAAKPYAYSFPPRHTALLVIDMQRDFLLPTGFGEIQGGNLKAVQDSITPTKTLLDLCRGVGMHIFHTREGHAPDLSDCPSSKLVRQAAAPGNTQHELVIGDKGAMGRLLTRGEYGHDIVSELRPLRREVVIDKPGKGAFWNTDLMEKLRARAVTHLIVSGVTTECCFATSIREANDRGFECCGIVEATAGYNSSFKESTLDMLHWSQGLFGFVSHLQPLADALLPFQIQPELDSPPSTWDGDLSLDALAAGYRRGLPPVTVMEQVYERVEAYQRVDPAVWIHLLPRETILEAAKDLLVRFPDTKDLPPLFGVPFSVKDSIDVAGVPTTVACPPLAFIPATSAVVYQKVIDQGAIFVGKVNMDQLAGGMTGCRSPYGSPRSAYSKDFISGGSSSGSAVSVGAKLVSFSLATDTGGSARVPASFNGIVGFRPTGGTVSFQGVTPACLSHDSCAFMAHTVEDVRTVWQVCEGYDAEDRYAKATPPIMRHVNSIGPQRDVFNFGIPPPEALAVCSPAYREMFDKAVTTLRGIGGQLVEIEWSPFEKAGKLLFEGTFVCERMASLPDGWLDKNRGHLLPIIQTFFDNFVKRNSTAVQAFRDLQAKALYTRQAEKIFAPGPKGIDVLVVPSAPTHWSVDEVLASPVATSSSLGTFTNFATILDMNGVAVPAGTYTVDQLESGGPEKKDIRLPFGVTLLGSSRTDGMVLEIARRFEQAVIGGHTLPPPCTVHWRLSSQAQDIRIPACIRAPIISSRKESMESPPHVPYQAYRSKRHSRTISSLPLVPNVSPPPLSRPASIVSNASIPIPNGPTFTRSEYYDTEKLPSEFSSVVSVVADNTQKPRPAVDVSPAKDLPSPPTTNGSTPGSSPPDVSPTSTAIASPPPTHASLHDAPPAPPPANGKSRAPDPDLSLPKDSEPSTPPAVKTRKTTTFRRIPATRSPLPSSPLRPPGTQTLLQTQAQPHSRTPSSSSSIRQFDAPRPPAVHSRVTSTTSVNSTIAEDRPFVAPSPIRPPPRTSSMLLPPQPPPQASSPASTSGHASLAPSPVTPNTSPSPSASLPTPPPTRPIAPYRPGFQPKGVYRPRTDEFFAARRTKADEGRVERTKLERRLEKLINLHFPDGEEEPKRPVEQRRSSSFFDLDFRNLASLDAGELWKGVVQSQALQGPKGDIRAAEQRITPWQDDGAVSKCPLCTASFHPLTNRKHHCRLCGKIMCSLPIKNPQRPQPCSVLFVVDAKTRRIEEVGEGVDYGVRKRRSSVDPRKGKEKEKEGDAEDEKFLKGVRICRECRPILAREQYYQEVSHAPVFTRFYEVFDVLCQCLARPDVPRSDRHS
ncbi:amidase signature enzyme [Leucogyrophana mollusca]|uniref:Amidase signature enzyme n=1 Tax=Leucogyrophana mollusca TaxID=85980 RepID=A0ACB8BNC9_9AGAM|nr:amidase signature enzyme [Leucogyrophana mollusca]